MKGSNFLFFSGVDERDLDQTIAEIQGMNDIQMMALTHFTLLGVHNAFRFSNIFQIVGYVATRNLELALSFQSARDIDEYYRNHQDLLEQAIGNLRFREITSSMMIGYTDVSSVRFVGGAANISEPQIITIDNSHDPFAITINDVANRLSILYGSIMAEKSETDVVGDSLRDSSI